MLVFCLIIFQFLILQNIEPLLFLFYFILMAETWMRLGLTDSTRANLSPSPLGSR